jgi:hypothetical protein
MKDKYLKWFYLGMIGMAFLMLLILVILFMCGAIQ